MDTNWRSVMKKIGIVMAGIMLIAAVGCGKNNEAESEVIFEQVNEPAAEAAPEPESAPAAAQDTALGVPAVKDGVMRPGDDCVEVYFEWDPIEGADGYEVTMENKYREEEEYREPETTEVTENSYVAGAQDEFDFRIKVRAFKGAGDDRTYGEWSSLATGSAY